MVSARLINIQVGTEVSEFQNRKRTIDAGCQGKSRHHPHQCCVSKVER